MAVDFDIAIERRHTGSAKWSRYPSDVLPLWVADMDFAVAPEIIDAIADRLKHPVFGYSVARMELREQIVADMAAKYDWHIAPDALVFLPGVEPGFNMALKAFLEPGDRLALQTPIYRPILDAPAQWGLESVPFSLDRSIEEQAAAFAGIGAVLLCNPHNPTGKVYDRDALLALARASGDAPIISDEIHCELVHPGKSHIPIASLDPGIARRAVTLMSASKTFNIAGLKTAFAIVENPDLRERFNASRLGMVDSVNAIGLEATFAAYRSGDAWKADMLRYLEANRDFLAAAITERFPLIAMEKPDAGFLAWLDCTQLGLENPQRFFLDQAGVALSAGTEFGQAYGRFVRLNFGCPKSVLADGLNRMEKAIRDHRPA